MRRLLSVLIVLCLLTGAGIAQRGGGHSGGRSSSSKSSKSSSKKTVHVREYTRKDGTVVHAHDRAAPGTADHSTSSSSTYAGTSYRRDHVADGYTAHPSVVRDSHGKIKRSKSARSEFMREHPCPANGHTSGRCPGYIVDHVSALECGGADAPSNMQWQTTADAKAKDRTERYCGR